METMETVYLLWQGIYSDAEVIGVFTSRQAAQETLADLQQTGSYEAQSLRLEEKYVNLVKAVHHSWECVLIGDGSIRQISENNSHYFQLSANPETTELEDGSFWFSAYGASKEHAIKNAADFRRAWLAAHPEALINHSSAE